MTVWDRCRRVTGVGVGQIVFVRLMWAVIGDMIRKL